LEYFAPVTAHDVTALIDELIVNGFLVRGIEPCNSIFIYPAVYIPSCFHDSPTLAAG
jgi:hypothetical protein